MNRIKEKLAKGPLLFDGAMGTYYTGITQNMRTSCEAANITDPETILGIHREYIAAGADAITTNTFGIDRRMLGDDRADEMIKKGWEIASEAVKGTSCSIFASIGPAFGITDTAEIEADYKRNADAFLKLGTENFVFETQSSATGLKEAAAYIKEKKADAFVMVNFAVQAGGFTAEGLYAGDIVKTMAEEPGIDAIGFNCGSSAGHLQETVKAICEKDLLNGKYLAVLPNAGYPVVVGNRTFYEGDPYYFACRLKDMAGYGAGIVGGCCGTTPAHIAEARKLLDIIGTEGISQSTFRIEVTGNEQKTLSVKQEEPGSRFWDKLSSGKRVIAVELDPPSDADLRRFSKGAMELKSAGADIITIADCPVGRACMDSSLLACKVYREMGMEAIPHMTCRDRNLNATKALMMGLYAEGIRNVLLVTGDPIPTAQRDEVKSVFQFNSRKLARFTVSLNEMVFPTPLHIFGALNVNARNFDSQLNTAKEKEAEGMTGFFTQPILTPQAFENLKTARKELKGYILGGIIPVVSERNALFMDNEINGINVDPKITAMYHDKTREECEELAVEISTEIAERIRDHINGYYLMTPFLRTGLITRIIGNIK